MQRLASSRPRPILTSLPLEVLLYFGGWWASLYWVLALALFAYKGLTLPYPGQPRFGAEFVLLWLYAALEPARLFLASKGNKTEQAAPLLVAVLLALPPVAMFAYYLAWQTYVLKLEVLINAISLGFVGAQALLGALAALRFTQAARYA